MVNNYLLNLEECVNKRFYDLSIKYDVSLNSLFESYLRRKEIISKCYPEYKNRYSHIIYYAYKGVERDYKKEVKQ